MRVLLLALLLAACQSPPVHLTHPDGRTAQCGPYSSVGLRGIANADRERQCIQDYQRQGFERTP